MKKLICIALCVLCLFGCGAPGKEAQPVTVAVIDTGISPDAIPAENIGEGHNYLYPDRSTADTYGHGTAVASVILTYAPDAVLIPLVCNAYENGKLPQVPNDTLAQMIRDAWDIYGCRIINISAGLVLDKPAIREAVEYVTEKGALVIASAGNDYQENPGQRYYPCAYPQVLAVGALNGELDAPAVFSQRGSWVDLYAPGTDVEIRTLSGGKRRDSGTSYGCAYVCAQAVLYWKANPNASGQQVRAYLVDSAQTLPDGYLKAK